MRQMLSKPSVRIHDGILLIYLFRLYAYDVFILFIRMQFIRSAH